MEYIELSINLLKTGLVREHTFTKVPPTKEGCYLIGVDSCKEINTLELLEFDRYSHRQKKFNPALGFRDHDGETVYIDDTDLNFDWLVYVE